MMDAITVTVDNQGALLPRNCAPNVVRVIISSEPGTVVYGAMDGPVELAPGATLEFEAVWRFVACLSGSHP